MSTLEVVIYTTAYCSYCHAAKSLLGRKGVVYREVPVDGDHLARLEMSDRAGGRTTVPQIFVGDRHIGGSDDLYALENAGKLDTLLQDVAG